MAARRPKPHSTSESTITMSRWLSAARIMEAIMGLLQLCALALVVQVEGARGDDDRAISHALVHGAHAAAGGADRKSTRLDSSHLVISYAVFCLKKKKNDHGLCAECFMSGSVVYARFHSGPRSV